MDKITALQGCIVTLGGLQLRVDQANTVAAPIIEVIRTLVALVQELKKEAEDADSTHQGETPVG